MNLRFTTLGLAAAAVLAGAATANAQAVTPAGTFGSLPAGSFTGSGIPTDAVMVGGSSSGEIGLSATQRYTSGAVTNNGTGTFYAATGESTGGANNTGMAAWNFDYFASGNTRNNFYQLFIDTNPAVGNSLASMFSMSLDGGHADSSNLGYFGSSVFNPNVSGEYSFALYQYSDAAHTTEVSHVAMNVDVGTLTTTPEPSSLALLGTGFVGLAGIVKRRVKRV